MHALLTEIFQKYPVLVYIGRLFVIGILVNLVFYFIQPGVPVVGDNVVALTVPSAEEPPSSLSVLMLCGIASTGVALIVFLGWVIQKITGVNTSELLEVDNTPPSSLIMQD